MPNRKLSYKYISVFCVLSESEGTDYINVKKVSTYLKISTHI